MPLTIANRSRDGVVKRLRGLTRHLDQGSFLPPANAFRLDPVRRINAKRPIGNYPPAPKQLADYIACSTFLHLADAWSFLSRATNSAICGDEDSATHLGYYAQLRAAMSILASEGIGVFKQHHFCVNNQGLAIPGGTDPTHMYCWKAFEVWLQGDGWQRLSSAVRPGGVPISEWLLQFPSSGVAAVLTQRLLRSFGLDLSRLGTDRDLRNESSYRPTAFRNIPVSPVVDELTSQARNAEQLLPNGGYGDCSFATAILAKTLAECFERNRGRTLAAAGPEFRAEVMTMCNSFGAGARPIFQQRLLAYAEQPPVLLSSALGTKASKVAGHHREVLARATVFCFMSSLLVRRLLIDANVSATNMQFWLDDFAHSRAVFPLAADETFDLWEDLEQAISTIDELIAIPVSRVELASEHMSEVASLCRYERFLILGMPA